jgi:sugar phosphate isomerase/epimerase
MRIGYRITGPDEVGRWDGEFVQISLYRRLGDNMKKIKECVGACRDKKMPYVLHPVSYPLLDPGAFEELRAMASNAGEALILHDETAPGGGRLIGEHGERFIDVLWELERRTPVSLENAINTPDAPWFWARFARSVTLDIGHMEAAGVDSVGFISSLDEDCIRKVDYVHIHHNNGLRGGLTDHWPLRAGCRELEGLRALLRRKRDFGVILEINEIEETAESLALIRAVGEGS